MDTTSTDTLLTSGQDTTAATGDQTTADTSKDAGTQTAATTETNPQGDAGNPAADGKTTEEGKDPAAKDGAKDDKSDDNPTGAPETYAEFTMPEGYELDEQLLGEFTPVLKELNLSQEAAQKVMDFAPKLIENTAARVQAHFLEQSGLAGHEEWAGQAKTDKEFGGEKFAENLGVAKKAMAAFASPELTALLRKSGLGNHPEMLRAFYRAGKAISEDGFVPGGKTATPANDATRLYGKSNMNP